MEKETSGEPSNFPYDRMTPTMKKQWEERLFNVFKQRNSLLVADAVLTWAFVLWVGFGMVIGVLYMINPARFPLRYDQCAAIAIFFIYYVVIGFIRRNTERDLTALRAQHPDEKLSLTEMFKDRRPYYEDDDPPLARKAFDLRPKLGMPRRGLSQRSIILWQFLAGFWYVWNYAYYVLYQGNLALEMQPVLFYVLHGTMTGGGLLILLKNWGFLVSVSKLLETVGSLAGNIMGHNVVSKQEVDVSVDADNKNT